MVWKKRKYLNRFNILPRFVRIKIPNLRGGADVGGGGGEGWEVREEYAFLF